MSSRRLIIYICILFIVLAIGVYHQMTRNNERSSLLKKANVENSENTYEDDDSSSENSDGNINFDVDYGIPCKTHKYYLKPNTNNTYEFEFRLSKEYFPNNSLLDDKLDTNDINIEETGCSGENVKCTTTYVDCTIYTIYESMWIVDASEPIEFGLNQTPQFTKMALVNMKGLIPGIGEWTAHSVLSDNPYGILKTLTINGTTYQNDRLKNLSSEELIELLGGNLSVSYYNRSHEFDLPLDKTEQEKEVVFGNISINISVQNIPRWYSRGKTYSFKAKSFSEKISITITITDDYKLFCIEGPAQKYSCF